MFGIKNLYFHVIVYDIAVIKIKFEKDIYNNVVPLKHLLTLSTPKLVETG
jgi:hypothetical protein